jgi:hypothetical protein
MTLLHSDPHVTEEPDSGAPPSCLQLCSKKTRRSYGYISWTSTSGDVKYPRNMLTPSIPILAAIVRQRRREFISHHAIPLPMNLDNCRIEPLPVKLSTGEVTQPGCEKTFRKESSNSSLSQLNPPNLQLVRGSL